MLEEPTLSGDCLKRFGPVLPVDGSNPALPANVGANVETAIITAVLLETQYARSGDVSLAHQEQGDWHLYAIDRRAAAV
jgi:hypothetical protein